MRVPYFGGFEVETIEFALRHIVPNISDILAPARMHF